MYLIFKSCGLYKSSVDGSLKYGHTQVCLNTAPALPQRSKCYNVKLLSFPHEPKMGNELID